MFKHEIGKFIYNGMTSQEIKERIKDFPDDPDIDYFLNLGYSKNTARNYRGILKKNNSALKSTLQKAESKGIYAISLNADVDFLILDTSALESGICSNILHSSSSVIVLYAVLREFDYLKKRENVSALIKYNIREQTNLMLLHNDKYHLIPFEWHCTNYTDEIILNYLMGLPYNERPTLLTADHNLATRAKCLGLEYIVLNIESDNNQFVTSKCTQNTKSAIKTLCRKNVPKNQSTNLGVSTIYDELLNTQKYNPDAQLFSVKEDVCTKITTSAYDLDINQVEYVAVVAKSKKQNVIKIKKIKSKNGLKEKNEFKCYCKDDIKALECEFHSMIVDSIKTFF